MNYILKEFFEKKIGLVPVDEAYVDFVNEYKLDIDKKRFIIAAHYLNFVKKKQISKKKYFVVFKPNDEDCLF